MAGCLRFVAAPVYVHMMVVGGNTAPVSEVLATLGMPSPPALEFFGWRVDGGVGEATKLLLATFPYDKWLFHILKTDNYPALTKGATLLPALYCSLERKFRERKQKKIPKHEKEFSAQPCITENDPMK